MKLKLRLFAMLFCFFAVNSYAQLPYVYQEENTGMNCTPPPLPDVGDLLQNPLLPDPFGWSDGSGRSTDFADWECRRNEIKAELEEYEIGPKPDRPANITASYADGELTVIVTEENGGTLTLTSTLDIPEGDGPFPVVIGMASGTGSIPSQLFDGAIKMPFRMNEVVTYSQGNRYTDDPYYDLYPDLTYVGAYSAWSWGVSRLIDGLELVQEDINVDLQHIAVTGCSYAGKMALFAGAFDERVALTIAQESGGGGVNSWRVAETIGDVEKISNTNSSWFMQSMISNFTNNVASLPHDHHELMAMIAPRALLVLGNPTQVWLGDESGYVASRAAEEVYKAFEIEDRFGFSFVPDHPHCQLPADSYDEVSAFVQKFLFEDESQNTLIRRHPFQDVDYHYWIDNWAIPKDPDAPVITIDSPENNATYNEFSTITIETTVTDISDDVVRVDFYKGSELLGSDDTAPYTFDWENVEGGEYLISAEAFDATDLSGLSNVVKVVVISPTKEVYKVFTPPTIDGIVDELWNNSNITKYNAQTVLVGEFDDMDLSGSARAVYDDTYIYLMAEVTDDVLKNDSPTAIYQDDNVEFYFDGNNAKSNSYEPGNDVQYSFRWDDGDFVGSSNGISTDGIDYVMIANETATGYIFEARIPWANIDVEPVLGKEVGFDFMINDDDDEDPGRDGKLSWYSSSDTAYQNPSLFGTIRLAEKLPTGEVYKVDAPPVIDGTIDPVWNNALVEVYRAQTVLLGEFDDVDLSGYSKALWDDTYIYLLAHVMDDVKKNDSPTAIYQDDNVEFYFDGNNGKTNTYEPGNDVQFSFRWDDGTYVGTSNGISTTGIEYVLIGTDDGYIFEAKIPWANIDVTPEGGKKIGFDFMINDDDDEDPGRDGKLSWHSPNDTAYQNPSLFGTITLNSDETLNINDVVLNGRSIIIYPNPAKNLLFIDGMDKEFEYQIIDITGKLQLSGKTQSSIKIENLAEGIYFLGVMNGNKKTYLKFIKN